MIAQGGLEIISNLEFSDWIRVFNEDARPNAALLDHLTHRCHLLQFQGESYRLRESLTARPTLPRARRTTTPPVVPTEEDEPTKG